MTDINTPQNTTREALPAKPRCSVQEINLRLKGRDSEGRPLDRMITVYA